MAGPAGLFRPSCSHFWCWLPISVASSSLEPYCCSQRVNFDHSHRHRVIITTLFPVKSRHVYAFADDFVSVTGRLNHAGDYRHPTNANPIHVGKDRRRNQPRNRQILLPFEGARIHRSRGRKWTYHYEFRINEVTYTLRGRSYPFFVLCQ